MRQCLKLQLLLQKSMTSLIATKKAVLRTKVPNYGEGCVQTKLKHNFNNSSLKKTAQKLCFNVHTTVLMS